MAAQCHILGVYRRPCTTAECCDVVRSFQVQHWLAMGDWNGIPSENLLALRAAHINVLAACDSVGQCLRTRWLGRRCLDYALASYIVAETALDEHAWSDHQAVHFKLNGGDDVKWDERFAFARTPNLELPPGTAESDWRNALVLAWEAMPTALEVSSPETAWFFLGDGGRCAARRASGCNVTVKLCLLERAPKGAQRTMMPVLHSPRTKQPFVPRQLRRDLGRLYAVLVPANDCCCCCCCCCWCCCCCCCCCC